MRLPIFDPQGHKASELIEIDEKIFGERIRRHLLAQAVRMYEARARQGTHATKTRKDVSGSGKKPWRQKGTGHARAGSLRSPLWRGGGTVFGPHPRDYGWSLPQKARKLACNCAWLAKLRDREVAVLQPLQFSGPKTKQVAQCLKNMGLRGQKVLIGIAQYDPVFWKSVRNLPHVSLKVVKDINAYHLLSHQRVILLMDAFEQLVKQRAGELKVVKRSECYPSKS